MPWLIPRDVSPPHQETLDRYLGRLQEALSDPGLDRNAFVREELARTLYGLPYEELMERNLLAAMGLDPEGITFEAEYYAATDLEKFRKVKPLLWFWKVLDLTPLGQSVHSGVAIRRVLAPFIFKRVGRNPKFFQNVEFSVGYNLELGDDVVVHRYVLLDDIGGIVIGDRTSLSDYVNVYSHTHHVLASPDVTLKQTIIGSGVRITYHATVLAGVRIGDDAMVGTGAVVTKDIPPHAIALGIPARPVRHKVRPDCPYCRRSEPHPSDLIPKLPDRKGNPDYPDFLPPGFGTREA
ncbi:MAG: acyltransferase [Thermaceae bacterium]